MATTNKHIKTEWDLSELYKNDKEIDKHLDAVEKGVQDFHKKYSPHTKWLDTPMSLRRALDAWEAQMELKGSMPIRYLSFKNALDALDEKVEAKLNQVNERLTKIGNLEIFFPLALGSIPPAKQKIYLSHKSLEPYHEYLKAIFETAKYNLTEPEEKILSLLSIPSYDLWVQGVEKHVAGLTVKHKGKDIPLSEASELLADLPTKARRSLWSKIMNELDKVVDFATAEMNAVVIGKKIRDELRGYEKSYTATVLGNENDVEEVEVLAKTVTDFFKISRSFYALKKDLLGLEELHYADRNVGIGTIKRTFTFNESVELLREALERFGEGYRDIFDSMLANGQIDVFPKKGKQGGAFASSGYKQPTYVFLNDVGTVRSFTTLAHEMGHAIHFELSKVQRPLYQGVSTAVAEVASTLFEQIALDRVREELSDREQVILLHDHINDLVSTIFRQIAAFNFEVELHETVRNSGSISKDELRRLMNKHMQAYFGKSVRLDDKDGNFFIKWSHFRNYFYVYTYAYGALVSQALASKWHENSQFEQEIRTFLSAGSCKRPYEIFADIGIDTRTSDFWASGLNAINDKIKLLRKLAKKEGMIS